MIVHKYRLMSCVLAIFLLANARAQPIKLLTYNIRLDVASDADNDWTHRKDFLVAQLKFYDPDIFGTQEGLPHQIAYLQKNLPTYHSEGQGREGAGKGESTHIFFKKSVYDLKASHTFWLSDTPEKVSMGWDAACLRVCTAVLLQDKVRKAQFWVFNTHLDHVGQTARENSIDLILKKIAAFNPNKLPVIFMGDLNSTPENVVISKLKASMENCRELAENGHFGPEGTFNGFHFESPVTKLIDYIFVSPLPYLRVIKHAYLSDSINLHYPSDHLAVYVEIEFLKKKTKKKS